MRLKTLFLFFVIFLGWILMVPASAMPAKPSDHSCDADIQTYCAQVPRKGEGVHNCLYQNRDQLTSACRDVTLAVRQHIHEQREECRPDAEKFCVGIEHGGGRIQDCLEKHLSELSADCRDNFPAETSTTKIVN